MKACRWYQLEFPGTLSGELRVEQEERVRKHVQSCPDCRAELDQFRMIDVLLTEGLPEPGRVRQFQQEFLKRFDAEVRLDRGRRRRLSGSLFQPALLPLAAAAGVAGFLVWSTPTEVPEIAPAVPAVKVAEVLPEESDAVVEDVASAGIEETDPAPGSGVTSVPAVAEMGAQQGALLDTDPALFLDYAVVRELDDTEVAVPVAADGNG